MLAALLDGISVVDLTDESGALAARVLADLGASVTRVAPPTGDPLGLQPFRHAAWTARSTVVELAVDDPALDELLAGADIVLGCPGHGVEPHRAPTAVWVNISPFGLTGPRATWRASDLTIHAATGNLFATGDPDRAPVRCAEPVTYAHAGPEAAFAALTALATGAPQQVDLSIQEVVMVASMGAAGRFAREHDRGRRRGANIGRTREIWPCADGWVSFGLRGGKARIPSLTTLTGLVDHPALTERDWSTWDPNTAPEDVLAAVEEAVAAWFAGHTMAELYAIACETNLMLAPINSPRELVASEQLQAREVLGPVGTLDLAPRGFVHVRSGARSGGQDDRIRRQNEEGNGAWVGTRILEFGAGAAGPIATRYFAEHGADVIRIESRSRPDFLRGYGVPVDAEDRLDRSGLFDALNPSKCSVAIDLKHPEGRELAVELVKRSDAVAENFAPRAMRGLGLAYDDLVEHKPDLVMISACLNGQTGPHRDYPGFGGQGSALAGFNSLTGWPDRAPLGPFGTITDSLAPRYSAAALAAALLHHRRTGEGAYLDLAQVEAGIHSLSPWVLDYTLTGRIGERRGNRSPLAVPHGVFPCRGDDRWIALVAWNDTDWSLLAPLAGIDRPEWATEAARLDAVEEVEAAISAWTAPHDAAELAAQLQAAGIEAVPVADFGDGNADEQLRHRQHFVALDHPVLGPGEYERNGFRVSGAPSGYPRPSPLLGQHTDEVLEEVLALDGAERSRLREAGAIQ